MPNNENPTTRFKVDISELKAGIQESNRLIRLANSEFKAASSGMDNWANSTDGLTAKINQLTSVQAAEETKLVNLKRQYDLTVAAQGANSRGAQELAIKINNQQAAVNRVNADLNNYNNRLGLVEQAQQRAASTGNTFESELKQLEDAQRRAASSGNTLEEELRNIEDAANDAGNAADDSGDGYTVLKDVIADLASQALQSAIQGFKDLALEGEKALDKLQASTGATDTEMAKYKDQLQELYNSNYGESLEDLGDKFSYIQKVTGETDPSKIAELTKNAIGLEDTFGSDFNETVRGVSNMMNHFGIDSEEAFDLFAKGSQEGLDYTSELGDNVAEYGGNFAQAGYSADEYFQLLKNGADGGAYNLDKVNDSINEVKNRLGDGTIEKNLSSFSTNTQDAFKNWQNGKGTMKDVIDSIVGDISNATSEQEALTMAQVAFGTMGEDANLDVVKALTTTGDTFKDVKGTMESVDTTAYNNLSSTLGSLGRTLKSELLQPIVDQLAPALTTFFQWMIDNMNILAPIIIGVATALGVLAGALLITNLISAVQKAMALLNTTMLLNPFVLIAAAVAGLVAAFIYLWNTSDSFRNFFINLWESIKTTAGNAIDAVVGFFKNLPGRISEWFTNTVEKARNFAINLKDKAREAGSNFVNSIINFIKNLPGRIWEWFTNTIAKAVAFKNDLIAKGKEAAKGLFDKIVNKIEELPGKMLSMGGDIVKGLWNGINDMAGWIKGKIEGFGEGVLNKLKDFFGIHSPSRVMRDVIGKNLVRGVADGITENESIADKIIKKFGKDLLSTLEKRLSNYKVYHNMSLQDEVDYWNNARKLFTKGTQDRIDADTKYYEAKKSLNEQLKTVETDYKDKVTKAHEDLKANIDSLIDKYNQEVSSRASAITSSMNLFDEFATNSEKTGSQLLDNLRSQVTGLTSWTKNIAALAARGVDAALISQLETMGPTASGEIAALCSLTDSQLDEYVKLWKDKNALAQSQAETELSPLAAETSQQIIDLVSDTDQALNTYADEYINSVKELGVKIKTPLETLKNEMVTNAEQTVFDFSTAIDETANSEESAKKFAEIANNVLDSTGKLPNDMNGVGVNTMQGLIDGLLSMKGTLASTMSSIITSAIAAAQTAADINSPSKIMRDLIGKNLIKGTEIGINEEAGELYRSMKSSINGAIGTAKSSLQTLGINGSTTAATGSVVNNYSFNQTNNSPKSLSRLEIYRQTRNQFRQLREV